MRDKNELEMIILKIRELIHENKGKIDLEKIKQELQFSNDLKLDQEITEEELKEILSKYDLVLDGAYKKFLDLQKFENMILNRMKLICGDKKVKQTSKNKIKEEIANYLAEVDSNSQEILQQERKEMLNNFNLKFDELYNRFLDMQKFEFTMLNYIKYEIRHPKGKILQPKIIKENVTKNIQTQIISKDNRLTREVKEMLMLKDYDLLFDWEYNKLIEKGKLNESKQEIQKGEKEEIEFYKEIDQKVERSSKEFNAMIKEYTSKRPSQREAFVEEIKFTPQVSKKCEIINFDERNNERKGDSKSSAWQK